MSMHGACGLLRDVPALWDKFTLREYYLDGGPEAADQESVDPVVSRYLIEKGARFEYPDERPFAVCLTHDVDDIYPPLTHTLLSMAYSVKGLDLAGLDRAARWRFQGKKASPYRNFKKIIALEEKFNARSSFFFLATEKDIKRFRYEIEDVRDDMGYIADKGWEVGLHGGYYSYDDLDAIVKEKRDIERVLGKAVTGYRNHYLRFKVPHTWELLEKSGFKYDTTVGYNKGAGFKNGMCHPFQPYDLNENRELGIVEIPLAVMDCALFDTARTPGEAWDITKRMIDSAERHNGVITMLWHNDVFSSAFKVHWMKLYERLLEYCYQKKAWITSGENIYRWWQNGTDGMF